MVGYLDQPGGLRLNRSRDEDGAQGFYLISLNRSRSDGLTGFIGSLIGGTTNSVYIGLRRAVCHRHHLVVYNNPATVGIAL